MFNSSFSPRSGTFGPPPRMLRTPVFFQRVLEVTVYACSLLLVVPLLGRGWLSWAEFLVGELLCLGMFVVPAVRRHPHPMISMIVAGSVLISLAGPQIASFWGPLHLMMFALLAWMAPYLRWHGALGAAVLQEVIFLGAKTGWTSERYQLGYLTTTVADMAGMFILAIGSKNWYDLNEAARKTAVELAAITGSSCDLIAVLDTSGLVRSVNGACRAILGHEPGELDGQPAEVLGAPGLDALGPQIRAGQAAYGIIKRARRKDGAAIWLEWNVEPLPELEALLCVGRDVTRRIGPIEPVD